MSEMQNPKSTKNVPPPPSSSSSNDTPLKVEKSPKIHYPNPPETPTPKISYPNPPETSIPEPTTLREQWRFAIRQYSKWYSHAWGTAILAGGAFFALGWIIKGSNPLPSLQRPDKETNGSEQKPSSDLTS
eukprot:TRINITY_DN2548_c0_g1_i4.p2 TRINITY_DN2548_c0_g1~~TRINITY_DN2548_c0_g1_i4.p2  ORF type:complete len:130 (-),score=22.49 TRINITY_DN2548_c0_g1_i4:1318-1707(-)